MYLYNVTLIVDNDVGDAVKQHLHTELFGGQAPPDAYALLELLDSPHEGITYCVQLRCEDRADIVAFQTQGLTALQTGLAQRYPGKVIFFDSIMKYL